MNTELLEQIDAWNRNQCDWTQILLSDCKAEIKQLNAELSKAREYVPLSDEDIETIISESEIIYAPDDEFCRAFEQAIIQRANLTVKE